MGKLLASGLVKGSLRPGFMSRENRQQTGCGATAVGWDLAERANRSGQSREDCETGSAPD